MAASDEYCNIHADVKLNKVEVYKGKWITGPCFLCEQEHIAEIKKKESQKQQQRIDAALENAMLAPRFKLKTLDNYIATYPGQKQAVEKARWFLANWKESVGLVLIGNTGTGKNHICAGILNEFVRQGDRTALCTEPVKMVRRIKESWKRGGEEFESHVIKSFRQPDLLIIDELGVQFGSDTERMYITEIINDRYNYLKPTILAGNVSLEELSGIIGDRAVDRFREGGKVVVFDWKSYRK